MESRKLLGFILNFPYTVIGLLVFLLSIPETMYFRKNPYAFVCTAKSFWWTIGYLKQFRAMTIGQVVLLGPEIKDKDLEHELVHVEQNQGAPLIQPLLYSIELLRKGYRNNKYEEEAYRKAGNEYKARKKP